MKENKRNFIKKATLGVFSLPLLSNISIENLVAKASRPKKPKTKVKINSYAVKRNTGE
ncbi:MAG TPA: hypothetical protein PLU67_07000 [Candidatus Kapabacteria bacterium]|jgi:hypothetical protein|nr:hypothetical protein [Candidatus Kapabacteria bacterium]HOM05222.1 hypothetical protein [Candidatus Kapabacteria bacterium]HOQ48406.1 hypothetical protein [Candidatus Kapabacteria bacterium]HPP39106.1 hypothetical protein [Candidatus Kapabacteria bacterium]HPU24267.1 hypothetical protein [Candidatus Kapabacteria bacterium]